jgi:hypothetical protein
LPQQFLVLEVPYQSVFFPPAMALHMSSLTYNSFLCGLWRNWDKLNGKHCCSVFAEFFICRSRFNHGNLFIYFFAGGGGGGVDVGSLVKGSLISELRISFFMLWISLICIVDLNFFAS